MNNAPGKASLQHHMDHFFFVNSARPGVFSDGDSLIFLCTGITFL